MSQNKVRSGQLFVATHQKTDWAIKPDIGTTMENILSPHYWAAIVSKMRLFDRIEVLFSEGHLWAELLVVEIDSVKEGDVCNRNAKWARVVVISMLDWSKKSDEKKIYQGEEINVMHRGPRKWSIVRSSDKVVLEEDIATKEQAEEKLAVLLEKLA